MADQKDTYETCAAIAAALPDGQREMFADLLDRLTENRTRTPLTLASPVRRWLRDAGWVKR